MNKVIIIAGDLAAGKTTYSKLLSEKYAIPRFNKDNVKEILKEQIGFRDREENLRLSTATFYLLCHSMVRLSEVNVNVILEANFHNEELEKLEQICLKNKSSLLILNLTADLKELHRRYLQREKDGIRHFAHLSIDLSDEEVFSHAILRNRITILKEITIEIDATSFSYQEKQEIFDKIELFLR